MPHTPIGMLDHAIGHLERHQEVACLWRATGNSPQHQPRAERERNLVARFGTLTALPAHLSGMLLTSSLEPTGPKSTKHYLVLQYNDRRNLVLLPKTYSDLERLVKRIYDVDGGRFYVETEELNVCKGKRVKIPAELWDDIAELLGIVYIVPGHEDANYSHPESGPNVDSQLHPTQEVISLNAPLVNDEVLLIKIGDVDFAVDALPSTKFELQLMEENQNVALTISIAPKQGKIDMSSDTDDFSATSDIKKAFTLATDHHIIVRKVDSRFIVLLDTYVIGNLETSGQSPITSVSYDLGSPSPFKGPLSANILPSFPRLLEAFGPSSAVTAALDKQAIYKQILACGPDNAARTSRALQMIRNEFSLFKCSASGTEFQNYIAPSRKWIKFGWEVSTRSMLVFRYTIPEEVNPASVFVLFLAKDGNYPLRATVASYDQLARFCEYPGGSWADYHTFPLTHPMLSPGDHTISFINHDGKIHALFDFKSSTVLPKTTLIEQKAAEVWVEAPENANAKIDIYEFGQ